MSKINISTQAIKISQRPIELIAESEFINEFDFFILSLPSDKLLQIAKFLGRNESKIGVQRAHKEDRDKEIGRFITSTHPFFPNTIIINFPIKFQKDFYHGDSHMLNIDIEPESAYIIDGQHRLKAFSSKYSNKTILSLPVSAYFGLELPTIAEIFTRINFYQKSVSKSLVYDLLEFNKDKEFDKYREAQEMAVRLNDKFGSVFYGNIKMLGTGNGLISQAAFVEALSTKFNIIESLNNIKLVKLSQKQQIIEKYFGSLTDAFNENGFQDNFSISTSVVFNVLIGVLNKIIEKKAVDILTIEFKPYSDVIAHNITITEIKTYGGMKAVIELSKKLCGKLEENGLL